MRVDLDARVVARDGEELGSVQRAVFDPRAEEVTHLVISTGGLLGHDVLLPIDEVERARQDGDAIRLSLSRAEVERLEPFVPTAYGAPPDAWAYTGGYGFGAYGGFVWPLAVDQSTAERGGEAGQTDRTLVKGALVYDRDEQDIGVVDDVRFDAGTGRLVGFVLRVGGVLRTVLGGGDVVSVEASEVERVGDGVVHLRIGRDELERRAG